MTDPGFAVVRRQAGEELRLVLDGEFDLGGVVAFEEATDGIGPGAIVVVDMRGLTFIDSSGLGCLMTLDRRARAARWSLRLEAPPADVLALLRLCAIDERIAIVGEDGRTPVASAPGG
jgi:anti-sigma B factor antagonist